jgi:protein tyrosine phosphatase
MASCVSPAARTRYANWDLRALFDKNDSILQNEFYQISLHQPAIPSYALNFCVAESMILSSVPIVDFTLEVFIASIYEHVDVVIMLMQEIEHRMDINIVNYIKNPVPSDVFDVKVTSSTRGEVGVVSTLELIPKDSSKNKKEVRHIHYEDWLDGQPGNPEDVAKLARIAMEAKLPLIHCVGGVGRSGTLAAVVSAYRKILQGKRESVFKETVIELRRERPGCVQTWRQYICVHKAVEILLQEDKLI